MPLGRQVKGALFFHGRYSSFKNGGDKRAKCDRSARGGARTVMLSSRLWQRLSV